MGGRERLFVDRGAEDWQGRGAERGPPGVGDAQLGCEGVDIPNEAAVGGDLTVRFTLHNASHFPVSGEVEVRAVLEYEGERGGRAQEETWELAVPPGGGGRNTACLHLGVPAAAAAFSVATITAEALQGGVRIAKRRKLVRMVPAYRRRGAGGEPSPVVMLTDERLGRHEYVAWRSMCVLLGLRHSVWDIRLQGSLLPSPGHLSPAPARNPCASSSDPPLGSSTAHLQPPPHAHSPLDPFSLAASGAPGPGSHGPGGEGGGGDRGGVGDPSWLGHHQVLLLPHCPPASKLVTLLQKVLPQAVAAAGGMEHAESMAADEGPPVPMLEAEGEAPRDSPPSFGALLMAGLPPKDLVSHMVKASREVRSIDLVAFAGKTAQHCFRPGALAARGVLEAQRLRGSLQSQFPEYRHYVSLEPSQGRGGVPVPRLKHFRCPLPRLLRVYAVPFPLVLLPPEDTLLPSSTLAPAPFLAPCPPLNKAHTMHSVPRRTSLQRRTSLPAGLFSVPLAFNGATPRAQRPSVFDDGGVTPRPRRKARRRRRGETQTDWEGRGEGASGEAEEEEEEEEEDAVEVLRRKHMHLQAMQVHQQQQHQQREGPHGSVFEDEAAAVAPFSGIHAVRSFEHTRSSLGEEDVLGTPQVRQGRHPGAREGESDGFGRSQSLLPPRPWSLGAQRKGADGDWFARSTTLMPPHPWSGAPPFSAQTGAGAAGTRSGPPPSGGPAPSPTKKKGQGQGQGQRQGQGLRSGRLLKGVLQSFRRSASAPAFAARAPSAGRRRPQPPEPGPSLARSGPWPSPSMTPGAAGSALPLPKPLSSPPPKGTPGARITARAQPKASSASPRRSIPRSSTADSAPSLASDIDTLPSPAPPNPRGGAPGAGFSSAHLRRVMAEGTLGKSYAPPRGVQALDLGTPAGGSAHCSPRGRPEARGLDWDGDRDRGGYQEGNGDGGARHPPARVQAGARLPSVLPPVRRKASSSRRSALAAAHALSAPTSPLTPPGRGMGTYQAAAPPLESAPGVSPSPGLMEAELVESRRGSRIPTEEHTDPESASERGPDLGTGPGAASGIASPRHTQNGGGLVLMEAELIDSSAGGSRVERESLYGDPPSPHNPRYTDQDGGQDGGRDMYGRQDGRVQWEEGEGEAGEEGASTLPYSPRHRRSWEDSPRSQGSSRYTTGEARDRDTRGYRAGEPVQNWERGSRDEDRYERDEDLSEVGSGREQGDEGVPSPGRPHAGADGARTGQGEQEEQAWAALPSPLQLRSWAAATGVPEEVLLRALEAHGQRYAAGLPQSVSAKVERGPRSPLVPQFTRVVTDVGIGKRPRGRVSSSSLHPARTPLSLHPPPPFPLLRHLTEPAPSVAAALSGTVDARQLAPLPQVPRLVPLEGEGAPYGASLVALVAALPVALKVGVLFAHMLRPEREVPSFEGYTGASPKRISLFQMVSSAIYADLRLDLGSGWGELPHSAALVAEMERLRALRLSFPCQWPPSGACAEAMAAPLVLLKGDPQLTAPQRAALSGLLQRASAALAPHLRLPEGGRNIQRLRQQVQTVLSVVPNWWDLHAQAEDKLAVVASTDM